ncbi:MAG: 1,4-dihydroxy-2-naphthoate octaprenyltransferase [Paludibacteraceae bacterium]|nr:1,4-dihydroxy-2-naphthoate octaprenyltransferase [Prevotellaceae bacterium]
MEVEKNSVKAWLLAARPKTLAAAVVPVMVGSALAYYYGSFKVVPALACLFFAVMMQIAANLINDLYDFLKGSDGENRLGPLRATAQGWITPECMRIGILVVVVIASLVGSVLLFYGGFRMIFVGAFCVVFAYFYTSGPYPLAYNGLGDVAVVLFFGVVAVGFTCYVQLLEWPWLVTAVGITTGLVVNTLLVLNNYRDRDTDKESGKRTIIVRLGEKFGRFFYFWSGILAATAAYLSLVFDEMSEDASFGTFDITLLLAFPVIYVAFHYFTWRRICVIREGVRLNSLIGETSRNMLVFSVLLSVSLILLCR